MADRQQRFHAFVRQLCRGELSLWEATAALLALEKDDAGVGARLRALTPHQVHLILAEDDSEDEPVQLSTLTAEDLEQVGLVRMGRDQALAALGRPRAPGAPGYGPRAEGEEEMSEEEWLAAAEEQLLALEAWGSGGR